EKAHPDVFNILLQVLDDGRLTDNKGRTVDFKNTIIIMTSNMGSHYIQEKFEELTEDNKDALMVIIKEQVLDQLKKQLRPEFLNRIDESIVFAPLSEGDMLDIVKIQIKGLEKTMADLGIDIGFTEESLELLASLGYDPQFGARPVKRMIQKEVVNALSKEILAGKVTRDSRILVSVRNGMIQFSEEAPEKA
ncbi:MAG: AAA family ATPase, partial [Bacteroidota bacterium]